MPYPHQPGLIFAVPHTGRPLPLAVHRARLAMAFPMNFTHMCPAVDQKPVDEARNIFADIALQTNCKFVFFWDEDVVCPPHAIPELVYRMENHPEAGVIGGVYCLKRDPAEPLIFRGNGNGPYWDWRAGEFLECSGVGMGCTIVRVEVFRDLKRPWFKTEFNIRGLQDGDAGTEVWTEDLWFCKRVTDTDKWKVYADTTLLCGHVDMETGKEYRLPPDSKPVRHMEVKRGDKKILDLGSGKNKFRSQEGSVITADPDESSKPDYRCDLIKLPFDNKLFDIVHSPALETLRPELTETVLKEWIRVLKPGGEMRLVIANMEKVAKGIAKGNVDPNVLYSGNRRSAFTFDSLKKSLEDLGMKDVCRADSDPAHIGIRSSKP